MEQTEKKYSPRYASELQRARNKSYIRKYYYTNGGKERKLITYYLNNYPELSSRKVYEDYDDLYTRINKIKDEVSIIKMERKLKMRVIIIDEVPVEEQDD